MKILPQYLIFAFLFILLTACPYESTIPLSDYRKSIMDTTFLGKWFAVDQTNLSDTLEINVIRFNSTEYLFDFIEKDSTLYTNREFFRGFITNINNRIIFNINEIGKENIHYFYSFEQEGETLMISCVSDNLIKINFQNETDIYNYFKKNINKKDFFEEPIIFQRKK